MRVAKLTEVRKIEVVEGEKPEISSEYDVQVKVKAVGICGTDLHIFNEGRADVILPRVMGHELSGEVTAVGEKVDRVKVGDRVALDPVFACGECPTCRKGYPNVCENVKCYGVQMDGGYQDYIVVHEKHLYPFDHSISFEQAALAEPFSIAANILERTSAAKEDNVIIIGADVVDSKLEKARALGADKVVNSKKESIKDMIEEFAPGGLDVVIDAVGITSLFQQSIEYAAPRGRIACIGFDAKPAEIPPVLITKKELSIVGSRMNCYQFPKVMKWLEEGKIDAEKMISRKYSIDDIQQAFEETIANGQDVVKTLIVFE